MSASFPLYIPTVNTPHYKTVPFNNRLHCQMGFPAGQKVPQVQFFREKSISWCTVISASQHAVSNGPTTLDSN